MGVYSCFIIKVDDPSYIPTSEQLERVIRLLDKYGLTVCNYPSLDKSQCLISKMRSMYIIRESEDMRRLIRIPDRRAIIERFLAAEGLDSNNYRCWIDLQGYDPNEFPKTWTKTDGSGLVYYIHLVSNEYTGLDYFGTNSPKAIGLETYPVLMEIHEKVPVRNAFIDINDPHHYMRSRFFMYKVELGRSTLDKNFISRFNIRFYNFLKEAETICSHSVIPDFIYT